MSDFDTDPIYVHLLEWLEDKDGNFHHDLSEYYQEKDLPIHLQEELLKGLQARPKAVSLKMEYAGPAVRILPDGRRQLAFVEKLRTDPGQRARVLRRMMLKWLHERENEGRAPTDWSDFAQRNPSIGGGAPFSDIEMKRQADYLHERGFIKGMKAHGLRPGLLRPQLTSQGEDCVIDFDADTSSYQNQEGAIQHTTNANYGAIFNGDAQGQFAWGAKTVNQAQQNSTETVAPGFESIAQAVADVLASLHELGLSAEDAVDAETVGREVLAEVTKPEPDRGMVRRAVATLRGYLGLIAAGAVGGTADGVQEQAQALVQRLAESF